MRYIFIFDAPKKQSVPFSTKIHDKYIHFFIAFINENRLLSSQEFWKLKVYIQQTKPLKEPL